MCRPCEDLAVAWWSSFPGNVLIALRSNCADDFVPTLGCFNNLVVTTIRLP